jgi:hypothetical protein
MGIEARLERLERNVRKWKAATAVLMLAGRRGVPEVPPVLQVLW